MKNQENVENPERFSVREFGQVPAWTSFVLQHPRFGPVPGKRFLQAELGLTGMEISLNALPAGKGVPFLHGHRQNEELYLYLSGQGQMLLDDELVDVAAGTAVRVAPPVMRSCRNTGTEPLTYLCIQAKVGSLVQATAKDGFIGDTPPVWPAA